MIAESLVQALLEEVEDDHRFVTVIVLRNPDDPEVLLVRRENPPEQGKWAPQGKSLFVRDGKLCYDIGWVSCLAAGKPVAASAATESSPGLFKRLVSWLSGGSAPEVKPEPAKPAEVAERPARREGQGGGRERGDRGGRGGQGRGRRPENRGEGRGQSGEGADQNNRRPPRVARDDGLVGGGGARKGL